MYYILIKTNLIYFYYIHNIFYINEIKYYLFFNNLIIYIEILYIYINYINFCLFN